MNDVAPETENTTLEFLETAAALERRLDSALSMTRGVSFSEYRLLRALSEASENCLPRIELARAVGLTASAVTRALKPLEKLGYVSTERSERDARQSLAVISPEGVTLLEDAALVLQDILRSLPLNTLGTQKVSEFRCRLEEMRRRS